MTLIAISLCFFYLFSGYSSAKVNYPSVEEITKNRFTKNSDYLWKKIVLGENIVLSTVLADEQVNVANIYVGNTVFARIDDAVMNVSFGYSEAVLFDEQGLSLAFTERRLSAELGSLTALVSSIHSIGYQTPRTNELFITHQKTQLYQLPDTHAQVFGLLFENLRYPINAIFIDDKKQVWFQIQMAGNFVYVKASDVEIDKGVPVLTFHHLLKDNENTKYRHTSTTTSDTAFSIQMGYLKKQGFRTVSLSELYKFLNKSANLPAKVFVITFDDGLKSVYRYAYPILDALDFKATVFMITSRIKRYPQIWDANTLQFMSVDEMNKAKSVFNYQSHSHFLHKLHEKKPIIFSRSQEVIEKDIERSRRALLQFNPQVDFFAYPFGAYNEGSVQAVKNAGIQMAFSTVKGKVKPGDNLLKLKRIYLLSTDSQDIVAKKVEN